MGCLAVFGYREVDRCVEKSELQIGSGLVFGGFWLASIGDSPTHHAPPTTKSSVPNSALNHHNTASGKCVACGGLSNHYYKKNGGVIDRTVGLVEGTFQFNLPQLVFFTMKNIIRA